MPTVPSPSPTQIEALLDKLNEDDAVFRTLLINDPATALSQYGIDWDNPDYDPNLATLPDPGTVNENRDAYRDHLLEDEKLLGNAIDFELPDLES